MMGYTGSISKGKVAPSHNLREFGSKYRIPDNIDFSRTKDNEVLVNRTLREVYDERFGDALKIYNEGRRASGHHAAQIPDYLEHIKQSKSAKPMYEFVVQCGNVDERPEPETSKAIYKEWLQSFEKSYGDHFAVKQAVIHMDEATPHMHLEVVPVAESKRGLPVQNSLNKAVEQSGFDKANGGYKAMLHAWDECLGEVMRQHGLERVAGDKERQAGGVPIAEYKAVMAARAEVDRLKKQAIVQSRRQARAAQKEKYAEIGRKAATKRAKERLERLRGSSERVGEQIRGLEQTVGDLESEKSGLRETITGLERGIEQGQAELRDFREKSWTIEGEIGELRRGTEQQQGELDAIRARVGELESAKSEISKNVRELIESIKKCLAELAERVQARLRKLASPTPRVEQTGGLSREFAVQEEKKEPSVTYRVWVGMGDEYYPTEEAEGWYATEWDAEDAAEELWERGWDYVTVSAVDDRWGYERTLRRWDPSDREPEPPTPNWDFDR